MWPLAQAIKKNGKPSGYPDYNDFSKTEAIPHCDSLIIQPGEFWSEFSLKWLISVQGKESMPQDVCLHIPFSHKFSREFKYLQ